MIRSIRAELLKLRTVLMPWGLFAGAIAATALFTVLSASRAGVGKGRFDIPALNTVTGQTDIFTATQFALLLALILGVMVAAGEYRHATATATALAIPVRGRVLFAKALVAGGAGIVFGLAASLVTTGVGLAFISAKGYTLVVPASTVLQEAGGAMLACGLLATVGVALGALIRSQVAAIVAVLIWSLAGEAALGALFPTGSPYFPFNAARSLSGVTSFAGGTSALPFYGAAIMVVAVAVALGVVATRTTVRADIS